LADDDGAGSMEPELAGTAHMAFVDSRCACCPYGYHIDIDFLRYLESLSARSPGELAGIERRHPGLHESLELFLRRRDAAAAAVAARGGPAAAVAARGGPDELATPPLYDQQYIDALQVSYDTIRYEMLV